MDSTLVILERDNKNVAYDEQGRRIDEEQGGAAALDRIELGREVFGEEAGEKARVSLPASDSTKKAVSQGRIFGTRSKGADKPSHRRMAQKIRDSVAEKAKNNFTEASDRPRPEELFAESAQHALGREKHRQNASEEICESEHDETQTPQTCGASPLARILSVGFDMDNHKKPRGTQGFLRGTSFRDNTLSG